MASSRESERALKRLALERGLLMMGPECGTAILDGVGLGFANVVERGPVGIVGASGTGIQALCCLLDVAGVGISHAIGVGGRDLDSDIGGAMTAYALRLLADDPSTRAIGLVGKTPPPADVAGVHAGGKPVVVAAPGGASLEEAAARLCELVDARAPGHGERLRAAPRPGAVLGLFSGGTLCQEAEHIVAVGRAQAGPAPGGVADRFIDFGAEPLTSGRPHPMIDPTLRAAHLEREAANEEVSALLVDVVLGRGAHPDPAASLADAIEAVRARRRTPLAVVATLCGTARDPQGLERQAARLGAAGATVTRSGAHAARLALQAAGLPA